MSSLVNDSSSHRQGGRGAGGSAERFTSSRRASLLSSSGRRKSSISFAAFLDESEHGSCASSAAVLMPDCSICLDPMHLADFKHPLQCEFRQCGFNFCMNCIESLIISSKDDYQEASDGNYHVKVLLHCPNCRSDLGWSIRDTLLLRKADFIIMNEKLPDEQLTASQLRLKHEIHTPAVQKAIDNARKLEADFFGNQLDNEDRNEEDESSWLGEDEEEDEDNGSHLERKSNKHDNDASFNSSYRDGEEWGVEADLKNGVHSSIRLPKNQVLIQPKPMNVDKTLLQGLDHAMSEDEQRFFTEALTSGDSRKLAEAARQLYEISKMAMRGVSAMQRLRKRSSIYILIDEAEEAHAKHLGDTVATQTNMLLQNKHQHANACSRQNVNNMLEEAEFIKFHPLPVRMPKYCELPFGDVIPSSPICANGRGGAVPFLGALNCGPKPRKFPVAFCDDVWDGSVMDAFCKITIAPLTGNIKKHPSRLNHRGVVNILSEGHSQDDFGKARIDVETKRILISHVNGQAGRQGIMKGDVVTHLDGESLEGKTSEELVTMLYEKKNRGEGDTFSLVLNADKPTAEALRRRAAAAAWWF